MKTGRRFFNQRPKKKKIEFLSPGGASLPHGLYDKILNDEIPARGASRREPSNQDG